MKFEGIELVPTGDIPELEEEEMTTKTLRLADGSVVEEATQADGRVFRRVVSAPVVGERAASSDELRARLKAAILAEREKKPVDIKALMRARVAEPR